VVGGSVGTPKPRSKYGLAGRTWDKSVHSSKNVLV